MARTPIFGFLARAIALARDAETPGPPADGEARLAARAAAASRRQFLQASSLAATAAALGGCASQASRGDAVAAAADDAGVVVVVVGAGLAGLVACHRLQQAGVPVRLFEAQARVGGRLWSASDRFGPGQVVELGAELIDTPHVTMRALAEELGLTLDDFTTEAPLPEAESWHFGGRRYSTAEVAEAFRPVAAAIVRDMAVFDDELLPSARDPERGRALDGLSIADWLTRTGVDGWLRALIEVAYTTEMGLDCDQQSALNLLSLIGTEPGAFAVFGASDERYHVRGGNDLIARRLAERVAGRIDTGARLLRLGDDGRGGYRLVFDRDGVAREVSASHVVLALPFTMLRQVELRVALPAARREAIHGLRYGTNAKLMIGFAERVWRLRHGASGASFSDLPYQTSWETTRLQPGPGGVLVNFVGGRHGLALGRGSAAEQAERAVADLDRLYPGLAAARAGQGQVRVHWPSNPFVLGSYSCYQPGDWTRYRGVTGGAHGRLHFAGEHASFDNWGFMEGAAETGTWAAAAIAAEVGRGSVQAGLLQRLVRGRA